ncbi:hypothetical protein BG015_010164 [Linnemannia schmuckeri]|uniref:Carboxylesterase type B domain-containing protein n=1 Tax=Linnemannia schmuckeri TaxID=64567 RepID=A0A9P5RUF6_9FUNG|nr:hypothetical protein BG015_010164 [Linnemannia schmuckeri]
MVVLKTILLLAYITAAAQATPLQDSTEVRVSATLVANAPAAKDVQGVHLLLDNDVDSKTPKNPVILLSKPRSYNDSQVLCSTMGEKLAQSSTPNLRKLLDTTPVAADEVKRANRYWVNNGNGTNTSKCMAFDRKADRTLQLSCTIKLPALCTNSLPRYQTGVKTIDKSKQIKVRTPKAGTWQGYRDQNQFRFLGIPYAEPPLGDLRFQKPIRLNPKRYGGNDKANDATEFGHACMQLPFAGANFTPEQEVSLLGARQSEDCLYLNVFTPSLKAQKAKRLPVMVYIHGGGFTALAGSTPIFEPGNVVSRGGVVVVTLNYRLSTFGLFENTPEIPRSKAPGNLAIRDQIYALRWVQNNIVAFGGDPSQVTIFGESAGGWSMRALLSAPSAFGLYKNVISQSDPVGVPFSSPKYSSDLSKLVMQNLNCSTSDLACARNKTADQVTAAQVKASSTLLQKPENQWILPAAAFRPTVDKSLIPADFADLLKSGKYNKKANVLWGFTKDEGNSFVSTTLPNPIPLADIDTEFARLVPYNRTRVLIKSPYYKKDNSTDSVRKAFGQGMTDFYWVCPYLIFSRAGAMKKSNFYTYRMNHGRNSASALGMPPSPLCEGYICHGDDLIPSFGSGDIAPGVEQTGDDARFARQVIDRFTIFAKTGNPNPPNTTSNATFGAASQNPDVTRVQWPKYDQSNPVFEFALANSNVTKNADAGRCEWLNENTQYDYQVNGPGGKFVPIFPPVSKPPTSSTKTPTSTTSGTTLIQTPSSISGRPTITNTITTVPILSTPSSMSDHQTTTNTLTTQTPTTIVIIPPPTTSALPSPPTTSALPSPPTTSALPSPPPTTITTVAPGTTATTAAPVETTIGTTTTTGASVTVTVTSVIGTLTVSGNTSATTVTVSLFSPQIAVSL